MTNKRRYYIFEILIGIFTVISCILAYILTHNTTAISMLITVITICLIIVTKLVIAENVSHKLKCLFNALTMYYAYSLIVHFFLLYLILIEAADKFPQCINWNYNSFFNFSVAVSLLFLLNKKNSVKILHLIITLCFIVEIIGAYKTFDNKVIFLKLQEVSYLVILISHGIYTFIGEKMCKEELGEGLGYYRAVMACRFIEYACILALRDKEYFMILCFVLQLIEVYCILKSVLTSCVAGHLNKSLNALQEAEEKIDDHNESSRMIVNLSHELKTPVNVIRSATDLLILDCQETELNQDIKELKEECNQVMNVIQRMIDIQKIKGGECSIRVKGYNLVELFENIIDAFIEEYNEISIIFNPSQEEMYTEVDIRLLQQGLVQLLVTMLEWDEKDSIYIEMNVLANQKVSLAFSHKSVREIGRLLQEIKSFCNEDKMIHILNLQFLEEVLALHNGSISYTEDKRKDYLEIQLPLKEESELTVTDIGSNNTIELRETIRYYYLVK